MRALVVTVVHTPSDARIFRRQVGALTDGGWQVTFAAPWRAYGVASPDGIEAVDLPRATGRHRWHALRAATRLLRRRAAAADVVVLHDPELLVAAVLGRVHTPVVWDVHEDTAASLIDRAWLPPPARSAAAGAVRLTERVAERRCHLLLAEEAYQRRFRERHPVVPNLPVVPDRLVDRPVQPRAVYLGRVSTYRGVDQLVAVGRALAPDGITLDLVGPADEAVVAQVREAERAGHLRWHGFLPNEQALTVVQGALAGLSLLHDVPNYLVSMPTKVLEYLACGVPAITTPIPAARKVVERDAVGVVVPFRDVDEVVAALRAYRDDRPARRDVGQRAHAVALERYNWRNEAPRFRELLASIAAGDRTLGPAR